MYKRFALVIPRQKMVTTKSRCWWASAFFEKNIKKLKKLSIDKKEKYGYNKEKRGE